jgi:hypothetical protein
MNVSHIENAGQVPIQNLISTYGSSPILDANWNDTTWNLEQTLGRVMGNLGVGVFLSLDIGPSLFNNSHHSLAVSETRCCEVFELNEWSDILGLSSLSKRANWAKKLELLIMHGFGLERNVVTSPGRGIFMSSQEILMATPSVVSTSETISTSSERSTHYPNSSNCMVRRLKQMSFGGQH